MAARLARPVYYGEKTARWVTLVALILLIPVFMRASVQWPVANTESGFVEDTQEELQEVLIQESQEAEPPQTEVIESIIFNDLEYTQPPVVNTPRPTDPPGTWSYETSKIKAQVTRERQDDFVYYVADIEIASPSQLWYAFSSEKYGGRDEALSDIAERHDPLLAINGDYYNFHDNGIIIRGGELFRKNKSARALLIVDQNGDFSVLTDRSGKQGLVADDLMEQKVLHTFEFGPSLVEEGKAVELHSSILRVEDDFKEPRTAIGQIGPLHYLVIVVDGRSEGYSAGCNLATLQQLFVDRGAQVAFNLDGGGSTTLWFNGEVINKPSSGDERKVSDIVMFTRE